MLIEYSNDSAAALWPSPPGNVAFPASHKAAGGVEVKELRPFQPEA
jgi:hypothetical protein